MSVNPIEARYQAALRPATFLLYQFRVIRQIMVEDGGGSNCLCESTPYKIGRTIQKTPHIHTALTGWLDHA